jgi:hypothetical protein
MHLNANTKTKGDSMVKRNWIFGVILLVMVFVAGCETVPEVTKTEPPPPTVAHKFEFTPPEKASKKTNITIGIVNPQWDKNISIKGEADKQQLLDVGINPKPVELMKYSNLTATVGPAPRELVNIATDFNNAVQKDYEAMMVARGFPIMGPFKNVDEMTYPQKTACNLIIVPELSQRIVSKPTKVNVDLIEGTAVIRTDIVLNIYEPLSKEKLWMKRFTSESKPFEYKVRYRIQRFTDKNGNYVAVKRLGITWDNRQAGFAQGFMDLYQEFMSKSWLYFSPEEMTVLKQHSDEIRAKKRF